LKRFLAIITNNFRKEAIMPTSVALTPHFEKFTQQLISSGQYNNVSEVVREGLRMVEEREKIKKLKLKRLKEAIKLGEDDIRAGRYVTINSPDELEDLFAALRCTVVARSKRSKSLKESA
jgi:antitoxin ParD1/3/4